jgi:hypothetical protein
MRRFWIILGLAAFVALGSDQALVGFAGEIRTGSRWQTRLRLFASPPTIEADADRGGALLARIPSFGLIGSEGGVYLPTRVVRIAIPEGEGSVRLQAVRSSPATLEALVLAAPALAPATFGSRTGERAAPRRPGGRSRASLAAPPSIPAGGGFVPPGEPIRIGDVGYLRDQRFVEVIYTPVVAPQGGGAALFHGEVEVDVVVEGLPPGSLDAGLSTDPLFESVYRSTFANYEEGRRLRRRTPSAQVESADLSPGGSVANGFPAYKIEISKDGIYRLPGAWLTDPGTGVAPGLAGADPRQFKIENRGIEIPIHVEGESDGTFGAGDYIEFYGQILDGPETILNYDLGLLPSIFQYDDYADHNIYWLTVDAIGTRERIAARSAPPNGGDPLEADFQESLRFEVDNLYQPTGSADPYLMTPRLDSNSGSVVADPNNCSFTNTGIPSQPGGNFLGPEITNPADPDYCAICRMTIPSVNSAAAQPATLSLSIRGTTDDTAANPDHLTVLEVNGDTSLTDVHCWDRNVFTTQSIQIPHAQLTSTLDFRLEEPGLAATASTEQLLVDSAVVSYRRLFQAIGDGLTFTVPDGSRRIAVSGLSVSDPAQVALYEITATAPPVANLGGPDVVLPVRVTGGAFSGSAGNFTLTFNSDDDPNSSGDRTYHLAGPGASGLLLPEGLLEDVPSSLSDPTREADVIVVGEASLMDLSPSSPFMSYWSHRSAVDGYVIEFVADDDIYDEFGFGIEHPEAIRRFLDYAYDNWKGPLLDPNRAPPAFVTLVGDTTVDPKNILNRGDWVNLLPAFIMYQESAVLGFYASDNYIAAFRGNDQLADVHLGRISLRTPAEADTVFTKLLAYESPPAGSWRGKGLFITDEGKTLGESAEFERITNNVIDGYWQPQPPHSAQRIFYDEPAYNNGTNATLLRSDISAALDAGTALMQYTGHGSFSIYGVDGWWGNSDVAALAPTSGRYFFSINENCLSGGFHFLAADALSEAFLKADDKGSVAFFAPAGLSFSFIGEAINDRVYGDMFGPLKIRRFGELITRVRSLLAGLNSIIDVQSYTLVGDPTQPFTLPAPSAPSGLQATGGDKQVTLSWTASADPGAMTRIWRATTPTAAYTLATPAAGVAGTIFVDTGLVNATNYFYYATSVDPDGYEGARTNLNDDCNVFDPTLSGPQCIWGRPLNLNPPSTPTNPLASGDGSGQRIKVTWTPGPESDLAGYVVRYGTQDGGPYPSESSASGASLTELLVDGLVEGTTYHLVLSAKNTSGLESAPSAQMTAVPLMFTGESPPAFISGLTIYVTPTDATSLTLEWGHPGLDIYGSPTTLASFEIFRDISPGFIPSLANRVAEISNPAVTTWTDTGAAVAPSSYYYLVGATDAKGYSSGLAFDLPAGVPDLSPSLVGGGSTVRFDWTPVATDIHGGQTIIQKYMLYAAGTPISRASIGALVPVADNVTGSFVEIAESPVHKYFTLIVVDARGNKSPY